MQLLKLHGGTRRYEAEILEPASDILVGTFINIRPPFRLTVGRQVWQRASWSTHYRPSAVTYIAKYREVENVRRELAHPQVSTNAD